jgi:hypothetical protein
VGLVVELLQRLAHLWVRRRSLRFTRLVHHRARDLHIRIAHCRVHKRTLMPFLSRCCMRPGCISERRRCPSRLMKCTTWVSLEKRSTYRGHRIRPPRHNSTIKAPLYPVSIVSQAPPHLVVAVVPAQHVNLQLGELARLQSGLRPRAGLISTSPCLITGSVLPQRRFIRQAVIQDRPFDATHHQQQPPPQRWLAYPAAGPAYSQRCCKDQ